MALMKELFDLGRPRALITLDEWDTLSADDETRVEWVEGLVVTMAPADCHHQRAIVRRCTAPGVVLPDELEALREAGVVLEVDPLTIRIPDLSVMPYLDEQRELVQAGDIMLAIEIVSPGSRRTDRVTKFSEYADAGVPDYWILDRDELVLSTDVLDGSGCRRTGELRGACEIAPCGATVSLDIARLV